MKRLQLTKETLLAHEALIDKRPLRFPIEPSLSRNLSSMSLFGSSNLPSPSFSSNHSAEVANDPPLTSPIAVFGRRAPGMFSESHVGTTARRSTSPFSQPALAAGFNDLYSPSNESGSADSLLFKD